MNMDKITKTRLFKSLANEFGFHACGISSVEKLTEEAIRLQQWLDRKLHGSMRYILDRYSIRIDPRELMPEARSVVSLLHNYFPDSMPIPKSKFLISKYAHGRDYHKVIRQKLKKMMQGLQLRLGKTKYRICVDSAPIMEKSWAARSGLGWIGKHTILLNESLGSYFFLSEILVEYELENDRPAADQCGNCRKCIEACPTGAIIEPYVLDARRCISYLTIEHKDPLPDEMSGTYRGWIFGCDICQDVCPFSQHAVPHQESQLAAKPDIFSMTNDDWRNLSREEFDRLFSGSAVKRAGYEVLKRNIRFVD